MLSMTPAGVHQLHRLCPSNAKDRKGEVMKNFEAYRKGFLMGADGQWHKVSEEIWTEYMRSVWREAARRREGGPADGKKKGSLMDSNCLPKVVSYESMTDAHGEAFLPSHRSVEEEVVEESIRAEIHDRLHRALEQLGPEEKFLVGKLYLEGDEMSLREYAEKYGKPRTTVQYQRIKLMKKLRTLLEQEEGFSPNLI
jgi:RNA polymerase sigma factor (sigma-70 family)